MPGDAYDCHDCGKTFGVSLGNDFGMYEFRPCPECGSAKTTFAST